jgi:hypothetical protein
MRMKKFFLCIVFIILAIQMEISPCGSKSMSLYAPPFNVFSKAYEVYACFGEDVGCKITIEENGAGGHIRFKIRKNEGNDGEGWEEYAEGTWIKAQLVELKLTSTGTGGGVKIRVHGK